MLSEVLNALDQEYDGSRPRRVSVGVEVLVDRALAALRQENSQLRRDLEAANLRVEFLETELHQLTEAKATGRRSLMASTARVVCSVFLAAAMQGATAGAVQGWVTGPTQVVVEVPEPSAASAIDFVRECEALLVEVDALPERMPDSKPSP
jgi:hypothetical protein